jgi:hypothetical protein
MRLVTIAVTVAMTFTPIAAQAQMPPRFGSESPYSQSPSQGGPSLAEQNRAMQQYQQQLELQRQRDEIERQRQLLDQLRIQQCRQSGQLVCY